MCANVAENLKITPASRWFNVYMGRSRAMYAAFPRINKAYNARR
tara:strand:+ start:1081 stop:1212 length:132 start_codon:yes stop_codon:yes gene_type:complete